jgi:hypothetical protein
MNIFPNIEKTRPQIMNHMKYTFPWKPHEPFINDNVQSRIEYIECISQDIK